MKILLAGAALSLGLAGVANAAFPTYPPPHVQNPTHYTFTAAYDGTIVAYFAGQDAGDTEDLGLLINGVDNGHYGLSNHSTALGTAFDFGGATVQAGDVLTFFIRDLSTGKNWYSDASLNAGGYNAVYATPYAGGDYGVPAGTWVAFEDRGLGSDHDYNDETFVFTNVRGAGGGGSGGPAGVPEPATWALMIGGFGMAGATLRRQRRIIAG